MSLHGKAFIQQFCVRFFSNTKLDVQHFWNNHVQFFYESLHNHVSPGAVRPAEMRGWTTFQVEFPSCVAPYAMEKIAANTSESWVKMNLVLTNGLWWPKYVSWFWGFSCILFNRVFHKVLTPQCCMIVWRLQLCWQPCCINFCRIRFWTKIKWNNWNYGNTLCTSLANTVPQHSMTIPLNTKRDSKKNIRCPPKLCSLICCLTANIRTEKYDWGGWRMSHCQILCKSVQQKCRKSIIMTRSSQCLKWSLSTQNLRGGTRKVGDQEGETKPNCVKVGCV